MNGYFVAYLLFISAYLVNALIKDGKSTNLSFFKSVLFTVVITILLVKTAEIGL